MTEWAGYPVRISDDHQRLAVLALLDTLHGYVARQPPNDEGMSAMCGLVLTFLEEHVHAHAGPMRGPLAELLRDGNSKGAFFYLRELRERIVSS